ncbi:MAG: rhodanese-like domain-containing protein [Myxococcota bacterium]|nr:rhodanese-like domain-containing protein [Myxococcota bacterium]
MNVTGISAVEAAQLMEDTPGLCLLDVRTRSEFELAQIDGSQLIPLQELQGRLAEIPTGPILVICHHGIRSMHAALFLSAQGFDQLFNLNGGIDAWSLTVDKSVPRY